MKHALTTLCLAACGIAFADANPIVRTAAELQAIVSSKGTLGTGFELNATALTTPVDRRCSFVAADNSGGVQIFDIRSLDIPHLEPGDRVLISGTVEPRHRTTPEDMLRNANCTNVVILSHGDPPEPIDIVASDMDRDDLLYRPVRMSGILIDVRKDEIDPKFIQFVIDCSNRMVHAASYAKHFKGQTEDLKRLVGATLSFEGVLEQNLGFGARFLYHRHLGLRGLKSIHVLKLPSDDMFGVPEIVSDKNLSPEAVASLGRRRAVGRVLAAWNGDTVLIRGADGKLTKVTLVTSPPPVGTCIETVGYAETDLFNVNLSSAIWRKVDALQMPPEQTAAVEPKTLLVDESGERKFNVAYHGKTVRLTGVVQDVTSDEHSNRRMMLASNGFTVAVDCGNATDAVRGMEIGSKVSVVGVCILETETWNSHSTLPHTYGLFIAVRSPEDVVVLARPPWWTPAKLTAVIGILAILLVVILIWNASLRILSERRGREIYRSQIARAKSELRVEERTRLAAELHDHLAQNLTAISYQIAAAERSRVVDTEASAHHLDTAGRMLGSCRTELRRCLWDLRSDALDESDINQAIKKSTDPITGEASVSVEVDAPRNKLSDSSLHTTLSIIRELVSNAVNHGHAKNIKVVGGLSQGTLRFAIVDDGCGFDVSRAPGLDEGHFGLAGVRERVRRHYGEMSIDSAPGKGTKVSVVLKLNAP